MTGMLYFALFRYYMLQKWQPSLTRCNICSHFDDSLLATHYLNLPTISCFQHHISNNTCILIKILTVWLLCL